MTDPRPLSVLTIAGSDSGGGAGIQADLKTFAAHRVHGLSALAALTAQHTRGVTAVHVPPTDFLRAQIDACFADFRIGAVKLGMLASAEVIATVADALERHRPAHVVLDPVMVATSGATLLSPDALGALRERLFPLATLITPNLPEARLLLGTARRSRRRGGGRTRWTGCSRSAPARCSSRAATCRETARWSIASERAPAGSASPTRGCPSRATAPAAPSPRPWPRTSRRGLDLAAACSAATDYVHGALVHAYRPGASDVSVLDHFWRFPPWSRD